MRRNLLIPDGGAIVLVLVVLVCCLYIRWWLPAPMPHKKEYGIHFSEHNSLRTLHKLTSFGPHPSGSLEGQQVVLFLQDTVRSIVQSKLLGFSYKLEISVGDGMVEESVLRVYRNVTNLMLRLYRPSSVPSRPSQALLLSSHWDSALDSPGASDDGVGVVVMIEILRNLVDYPTLFLKSKLDLIFLWCGSEELGLLGSDVFLTHPWSKDVVSFINIEAVGAGGPEYIFQIGNNWMTEAYASSVLYPRATSLGQDFFEKKLIIGNTDYVNYKKLTENGIDMAFIENGYVYHTYRDTIQEIVPGTIQHVGDNVLSLVIYIIQNPPTKVDKIRSMYYDIFHFTVFSVPLPMGILLGWTLCLIGLSHLLIVSKLRLYPLLKILIQALTFLLGFMSSVIFSCAISHIFHLVSPIGNRTWFSKPELALVFFLPGSTLGFLFIFSISSKIMKKMGIVNDNLHNGLLAFYILVSAPILWLEMASSFYPIIFVINILLSFHLSNLFSSYLHLQEVKMWWNLFLLFMLPSNVLFTDQTISLIVCYLPMMAKISNDLVHLVMALFTGTFFFFGFLPTLAYVWQHNLLKRCSKGAALILVMSIVLMLIIFPFSLHYPIRAVAYHKVEMEAQEITKNSILFSPIGNPTTRNPSLVFNEVELGFIWNDNATGYPVPSITRKLQGGWEVHLNDTYKYTKLPRSSFKTEPNALTTINLELPKEFISLELNVRMNHPCPNISFLIDHQYLLTQNNFTNGHLVVWFFSNDYSDKAHTMDMKGYPPRSSFNVTLSYISVIRTPPLEDVLANIAPWFAPTGVVNVISKFQINTQ